MDHADDSTAVVRIKGNFYDFISGCPTDSTVKRLKFDTSSLCESTNAGADRPGRSSEVIAAKAEVTQLQSYIISLETELKEAKLKHESELEKLVKEHQKDLAKNSDIRNQLLAFVKKENERKLELMELKQELEKSKEFKRTVAVLQNEKVMLQAELEQTRHDMENTVANMDLEARSLTRSLQQAQRQVDDYEQLLATLRTSNERKSLLEHETENFRSQLSDANMKIKELEKTISRYEEDGKIVQMMKSQLSQMKQFESENKSLKEENQYLSAVQKNNYLLSQEKEDLSSKLERLREQYTEMSKFQVLCEDLQKRLAKWESIDETNDIKSPSHMRQHTAELQREIKQLLEKNGRLQADNHLLEEAHKSSTTQLQSAKNELSVTSVKLQDASELIRKMRKKLIFVTQENELFKNIIDKYNNHDDDLTSRVDTRASTRINHLEQLVEKCQKHITSLQSDLDTASEDAKQFKMRAVLLEQQLQNHTDRGGPVYIPTTNAADQNIILGLRQKVADLEKQVEELTEQKQDLEKKVGELVEQKEEALAQLERVDLQGGYDRSKTRVLHFRMNPYSTTRNQQTQEIDRLREENARLHAKLNLVKEAGGPVEGLSVIVDDNVCPPGTAKELEETKSQLVSEQLKNQRLMEAFKKKSQELREVNYKVLGYRVDMPTTDEFRLMSMYAESPNDFFIFKQCANGELQLLANKYSESFQKNVETYLAVGNSLPAFMSSVTLELYGRQTMMQTSSCS